MEIKKIIEFLLSYMDKVVCFDKVKNLATFMITDEEFRRINSEIGLRSMDKHYFCNIYSGQNVWYRAKLMGPLPSITTFKLSLLRLPN